jgi:D-alanine--poly(phosphoribitol) ligase subunit 1
MAFGGTQHMYEYNLGIRFQTIADEHAQQTAIWFNEHETVTYEELNKLANRVARWLIDCGVTPSEVVCLSGEKSRATFACMLACLKIGAIYSVLDPDSPAERLRKIIARCRPKLLLAPRDLLHKLERITAELGITTAEKDLARLEPVIKKYDVGNLPQTRNVTGTNAAYLMFTSGSTGFPKGAVMTHANVLNLIEWSTETFRVTADDRLTNVNPLYFDNSVFDFYSALFTGACLVPFSKEETRNPKLLVEKIDAALCTLWFSVPSLLIFLQTMKATDGKRLRSIRRFVFGGEGYPKAKLKSLYDAYSDGSEFFNVYGPTECTCICSCYKLTDRDFDDLQGLPPLGNIANNFAFLILDDEGRAVPEGETGELCLLGPNVAKGYHNDRERTAASFAQNPYNESFPEVMYKTGDLVKLDPADGKLYIQGRKDNQIKHMGYRVELEEIEAALHCLDYVSEAVVLHTNVNGLSRIIAIVAGTEFDGDRIRADLGQIIPDYMVPSAFHLEDALPKNANGKVDRLYLTEKYLQPEAVKGSVSV